MNLLRLFRPSPAVIQNCSSSLFVENKTKKLAPAVIQTSSSSSNFFTKCTVSFHFWKATVHFVKIKKPISFTSGPTPTTDISSEFFSLSSHFFQKFISSSHLLSLFSALSPLFALSVVGSSVVGLAGVGLVLRGLGLPCPIPASLEVTHPCRSRPGQSQQSQWIRFCKERVTGMCLVGHRNSIL